MIEETTLELPYRLRLGSHYKPSPVAGATDADLQMPWTVTRVQPLGGARGFRHTLTRELNNGVPAIHTPPDGPTITVLLFLYDEPPGASVLAFSMRPSEPEILRLTHQMGAASVEVKQVKVL